MEDSAFAALYAHYERPVRAHLAWLLSRRYDPDRADLVDDLTQDTFIRFWTALQRGVCLETDRAAASYLRRIALNLVRDEARRRAAHATVSLDRPPWEDDGVLERRGCEPLVASCEQVVDALTMQWALAQLRPRERQSLGLLACGYNANRQAALLGLSRAAARMRLVRARVMLRRLYQREESRHA